MTLAEKADHDCNYLRVFTDQPDPNPRSSSQGKLNFITDLHSLILAAMIPDDIVTKKDLEDFKKELFTLLATINSPQPQNQPQWLKNVDVKKMLDISTGTLQNLRLTGSLPFSKIGRIYYYKLQDIEKMLNASEKKSLKRKL